MNVDFRSVLPVRNRYYLARSGRITIALAAGWNGIRLRIAKHPGPPLTTAWNSTERSPKRSHVGVLTHWRRLELDEAQVLADQLETFGDPVSATMILFAVARKHAALSEAS